jgi:HPt (histidine-containing phosphotransfer) domain-containing protein
MQTLLPDPAALHRELHKLTGAAACYQCPEIQSLSADFESLLEQELNTPTLPAGLLDTHIPERLNALSQAIAKMNDQS